MLRSSTSQEIKGSVLGRGVSLENLVFFLVFPVEGMLTWNWDASCKLLQAIMLGVSKPDNIIDKIFALLSNEDISLVGSCFWN